MKRNFSIAQPLRKIKMSDETPINPETIMPSNGGIHPARLTPGEPLIDPERIDEYQEAVQKLTDSYQVLVAEQHLKEEAAALADDADEWSADDIDWSDEEIYVPRPETKREELYRIQESKRAAKVQVDQKFVMIGWLVAVTIAFVSSAIVSFNGITAVAEFVGLSASWMAGLFFFFIELMYLIFLVAYLVLASRVDEDGKPEKTWGSLIGMISFGGIAVLANAFHTFDFWNWDFSNPQAWAGVVLSIAAPIAIISASKLASRVVFARAIKL
jgi:hypothetical protein